MFIAKVEQDGGCDYTIACGTQVIELKSETLEAAQDELAEMIEGDLAYYEIKRAEIYEVAAVHKYKYTL